MPKIEVDEAEYNQMVQLRGVANKIVANPAARRRLEEAHKLVDPNASTPLLDQDANQLAPVKELEKTVNERIAKFEKEQEDTKREQTLAAIADKQTKAFNRLKTEERYTDEGVEAIRKVMEAKGLLDVDDAVAIWERANPPQMPATPAGGMTGTAWGFADVDDKSDELIKQLISSKGENDHVTNRMTAQALQDFRSGKR
jgi:hypothetical protein